MSETIISKRCSECEEIKSFLEFYKQSDCKDGHKGVCKNCFLKIIKKYQQTEKGKAAIKRHQQSEKYKAARKRYNKSENHKIALKRYKQSEKGKITIKRSYLRYPERFKARNAVNHAIGNGQLPRPDSLSCHYCPTWAKQYHHWKGYEFEHWLDVVPVCRKCHQKFKRRTA